MEIEPTSSFVLFAVPFLRHTFGSRFLSGMIRRVLFTMAIYAGIYWFVSKAEGFGWLLGHNPGHSLFLFGCMAIAFTVMAIYRKTRVRLERIRKFEVYSYSSGQPYLIGIGRAWIRFLNHRAIDFQRLWNKLLSAKNKFEPRADLFWNDAGVTRKYIEPFLFLILSVVMFFAGHPMFTLWFFMVAVLLRGDGLRFQREYNTHYTNMQDNELIAESKARVLRRRQTNSPYDDTAARIKRAVEFGDTSALEEEFRQESLMLEQEKKQLESELKRSQQQSREFDNYEGKPEDFSLDDAFDSLQNDPKE